MADIKQIWKAVNNRPCGEFDYSDLRQTLQQFKEDFPNYDGGQIEYVEHEGKMYAMKTPSFSEQMRNMKMELDFRNDKDYVFANEYSGSWNINPKAMTNIIV